LVQNIIAKYKILKDDIYNFDEIEFHMRVINTARMMIKSERINCSKLIQSENQK
ncbi:hypothetical protein ACO22_08185, partial [Paracoccidioides brasiliensis]